MHSSIHTMRNIIPEFGAIVETHREGKWFVATDLIMNVSDYGVSEEEALERLEERIQARYISIFERQRRSPSLIDVTVHA